MSGRTFRLLIAAIGALLSGLAVAPPSRAETPIERGRYLVTIIDCGGCHTTGGLTGQPDPAKYLAGSDIGWLIPTVGIFYPSNLTPDKETGIGAWSEDDIVKALKTGVIPGGRVLSEIMPWRAFSHASDADLHAIAAFLKSIPSVHHAVLDPSSPEAAKSPYLTVAPPAK